MPFDANDPDTQAAIQAAVDAAVEPLKANNKKLVGELRQAKKGAEVDPADIERLETELDATKAQLAEANKAAKAATKAAEDATKALEGERGAITSLLVDQGLQSALLESGVKNPAHLKAAAALLKTSNKIEVVAADDGTRTAQVGGKALGEFVKGWAAGDDGKAFVTAQVNTGGGAAGGGKGGAAADPKATMGGDAAARHARIEQMKAEKNFGQT